MYNGVQYIKIHQIPFRFGLIPCEKTCCGLGGNYESQSLGEFTQWRAHKVV